MTTTLLLADDSVTIQRVIELTFANEGIRVVSTGDGEAAMRHIAAERPDIVLADVGMPKMDGYDVATNIKKTPALKDIPVLLLTGAFEPIDEARARASGCDGILVKPFEPQQLVGRVKELLAGAPSTALWPANLPTSEPRVTPARAFSSVAPTEEPGRSPAPPVSGPVAVPPPGPTLVPAPAQAAPPLTAMPTRPELVHSFHGEFDQLDAAIADLDPDTQELTLEEGVSDLADGLGHLTGPEPAAASRQFGNWDLPKPPPQPEPLAPAAAHRSWDLGPGEVAAPDIEKPPVTAMPPAEPAAAAKAAKVSMASAFSALLAAEQAQPRQTARPAAQAPVVSEAAVEDVVRRVLARMTHDAVQRIVLETAERLIKEELDKIRANPT